jgi:flagellar basal-body rod protein FlgC
MVDAIDIAASGLTVHRQWLDALSDNIANMNDEVNPSKGVFQEKYVQATAESNGQYGVTGTATSGSSEGTLVYDPQNPVANKDGYVRKTSIDLGTQMSELIMAQRGYQANAAVVDRAKTTYEAALQIGKS